jgi:hypothetical protein
MYCLALEREENMLEYPQTLEEAKAYRYHQWAGNPKGNSYREGHCAYEVYEGGRGATFHQCDNSNGHGPSELYCKTHALKAGGAAEYSIWYAVSSLNYSPEIKAVKIIKFTDKSVWTEDGSRSQREGIGPFSREYYPTFYEARKRVMDHLHALQVSLKQQAATKQVLWDRFSSMEEPNVD